MMDWGNNSYNTSSSYSTKYLLYIVNHTKGDVLFLAVMKISTIFFKLLSPTFKLQYLRTVSTYRDNYTLLLKPY